MAQTTDSLPFTPVYTFQVNLPVLQQYSWLQPAQTTLDGNEVTSEFANLRATHSSWISSKFPGVNIVAEHDGFQFTMKGTQAVYFYRTYISNPPNPLSDMLTFVSGSTTPW